MGNEFVARALISHDGHFITHERGCGDDLKMAYSLVDKWVKEGIWMAETEKQVERKYPPHRIVYAEVVKR
jgi:hypothetical protein